MPRHRFCSPILLLLIAGLSLPAFTGEEPVSPPDPGPSRKAAASTRNAKKKPLDSSGQGKRTNSEVTPFPVPERSPRVLLITKDDCENCRKELTRLRLENGAFDALRRQRWKIGDTADCHVQIVNSKNIPALIDRLGVQEYPTVACIAKGEILRSFTKGCRTPLDEWTFGWLLHGRDERFEPLLEAEITVDWTGYYPLRGNHWSVEGEWLPTFEYLVEHMRGENHLNQVPSRWPIETWSYDEVRSLHDDVHENDGMPRHPLKRYRLPPPLPESKPQPAPSERSPA